MQYRPDTRGLQGRPWVPRALVAAVLIGPAVAGLAAAGEALPRLDAPAVRRAFAFLAVQEEAITAEQIRICEIAAPTGQEAARGAYVRQQFEALGMRYVHTDAAGNVFGAFESVEAGPVLVLCAHLDTVFPAETDVTVRRMGTRLMAPGIADNSSGVAALLALARALHTAGLPAARGVVFMAGVGEEGRGDLRGVQELFRSASFRDRIDRFIAIDSAGGDGVINQGIGSRRFSLTFAGPGGHSWAMFGLVNPIHALGRAIDAFVRYPAPATPRTTFNVGMIRGGTSVNSIPFEAAVDVDLRSESPEALATLETHLHRSFADALAAENTWGRGRTAALRLVTELIGDRPAGATSPDSPLVRAAIEALTSVGLPAALRAGSTDSNLPMSRGIPAVTLPAGGTSGGAHALDEWYDPQGRLTGLQALVLLILAVTGG